MYLGMDFCIFAFVVAAFVGFLSSSSYSLRLLLLLPLLQRLLYFYAGIFAALKIGSLSLS